MSEIDHRFGTGQNQEPHDREVPQQDRGAHDNFEVPTQPQPTQIDLVTTIDEDPKKRRNRILKAGAAAVGALLTAGAAYFAFGHGSNEAPSATNTHDRPNATSTLPNANGGESKPEVAPSTSSIDSLPSTTAPTETKANAPELVTEQNIIYRDSEGKEYEGEAAFVLAHQYTTAEYTPDQVAVIMLDRNITDARMLANNDAFFRQYQNYDSPTGTHGPLGALRDGGGEATIDELIGTQEGKAAGIINAQAEWLAMNQNAQYRDEPVSELWWSAKGMEAPSEPGSQYYTVARNVQESIVTDDGRLHPQSQVETLRQTVYFKVVDGNYILLGMNLEPPLN